MLAFQASKSGCGSSRNISEMVFQSIQRSIQAVLKVFSIQADSGWPVDAIAAKDLRQTSDPGPPGQPLAIPMRVERDLLNVGPWAKLRDISPLTTLSNWGSSSKLVRLNNLPERVNLGSSAITPNGSSEISFAIHLHCVVHHGSKFIHDKGFAVQSHPLLSEQDWTPRIEADPKRMSAVNGELAAQRSGQWSSQRFSCRASRLLCSLTYPSFD